ncbi:unnamed protein product [marine sediment metagenome]|uniref:Methyltransferase domain-containing protein n=1 Tax=marine sediment metagenome TaxID=412755 RepID=X1RH50_9ZZZZ
MKGAKVKGIDINPQMLEIAQKRAIKKNLIQNIELCEMGVDILANYEELKKIREIIKGFKKRDYYVTLGSLLDDDTREYYKKDNFTYLLGIIDERLSYE